jgi:N-acetyl-gamma-glutamyl-phosphate reductase
LEADMAAKIFIDGEAGTTGLQIRERLADRQDLELLTIAPERRKDEDARRELLNAADVVVLCLPDEAARQAVTLIENNSTRVIDASTAHRVAPGWVYGFAEMADGQREAIASAARVTNPGCYPTGMIALVRPLVEADLIPAVWPITVNAVSGYSGGGKSMIAEFEEAAAPAFTRDAVRLYGLSLKHKHVPEMQLYGGLENRPLFAPSVGRYYKGMIVEVPLQLWSLPSQPTLEEVHAALQDAYPEGGFVEVASLEECRSLKGLDPEGLNDTNRMKLFVFGDEDEGQARLVALLDNLGKGASGAAVQNLNIMLGLGESLGL